MSAICGWMNLRCGDEDATATLDAMARKCVPGGGARVVGQSTASAANSAVSGLVPISQHRDDQLLVVLLGQVRWGSNDLAGMAKTLGGAAAAARAYREYGADCVKQLHGPFALAICDGARNSGLLAIDRMAIRRLCYSKAAGGVVFSTSAEAVAAHPAVGRQIDPQGIYNYLYCENVPGPGSIFEGVSKLLPGQRLIVEGATASTDFYWQLEYHDHAVQPAHALRDEFRGLLRGSVSRAATDDALGTFLSGGTDSSTVTGMLTELRHQPVDTYSIGFEAEGFDEMDYARITSRHFGTRAHEYYVTPEDVADAIPLIAGAYDEPFGNASAVPTYYCARLAAQDGKKLLLAGDGGDELFGGNARYAKQKVFEWYRLLPAGMRRGLIEPALAAGPWMDQIPPLRKARSYVQQARVPLPQRLETYNFLEREALGDVFEPDFLAAIDPHRPRAIAREVFERTRSRSAVNRMMHLDLKETLADNDLRKVNAMCELAGIAVHYPLLDDELVEFSGRLTSRQKVKGLRLRHFFKEALKDFLPPETITKTKHGFGLPFGVWMQGDARLRDMGVDSLRSFGRRGYVRTGYVERLLTLHQASHAGYYGVMIWIVMMLENWLRAHDV